MTERADDSTRQRRGRPRTNPSPAGVDPQVEIIEAAVALIQRDGLDTLTPSTIAREMGVARTVIYHHFGDIDGVISGVGDLVMAPLFDIANRLAHEVEDVEQRIRGYYRSETQLLASTPVPIEQILSSRRLDNGRHTHLWQSLASLETTLVDWLTTATGLHPTNARTRLAAATSITLGLRTLWTDILKTDLEHIHQLQLTVLGIEQPDTR